MATPDDVVKNHEKQMICNKALYSVSDTNKYLRCQMGTRIDHINHKHAVANKKPN